VIRAWKTREVQRLGVRAVGHSDDVAQVIAEVVGADMTVREHIVALGLDANRRIVAVADGVAAEKSPCYFKSAELVGSLYREGDPAKIVKVILGHNHPSGNAFPSQDDLRVTRDIICRSGLVPVVDHVIVATGLDGDVLVAGWQKKFSMWEQYGDAIFKRPTRG
jgi:DNA repair protein RadC